MERKTAILAKEFRRYDIDIVALSETHLLDEGKLEEVGTGYTFFWKGRPSNATRQSGVGFAVKSSLVGSLDNLPRGINDRLMTLRLPLSGGQFLTLVSSYAPTMNASEEIKENFYDDLSNIIGAVPKKDKLLVLGDFNARVGSNHCTWKNVLGKHGIGRENSNGSLLLSLCSTYQLVITNTLFQQKTKYKTTWMHPRSKHWHQIDFIIIRQRDISDVRHTRVMRGASASVFSDHRLVRSKLSLSVKKTVSHQSCQRFRKLNVSQLNDPSTSLRLKNELTTKLQELYIPSYDSASNLNALWSSLHSVVHNGSYELLGKPDRKHQDWFDQNDTVISHLLDDMHRLHHVWLSDKRNQSTADAYHHARKAARARLSVMKNKCWLQKAEQLQLAADQHNSSGFYQGLKEVFGPSVRTIAPLQSVDNSRLLYGRREVLTRWGQHFASILNHPTFISQEAIDSIDEQPDLVVACEPPSNNEINKAIRKMSRNRSPGADGLPAEIFQHGGELLLFKLGDFIRLCWELEDVPQNFKDANIIHLYKKKGSQSDCNNHRGISLLSVAGKLWPEFFLIVLSQTFQRVSFLKANVVFVLVVVRPT